MSQQLIDINPILVLAYINKGLNTYEKLSQQFSNRVMMSDLLMTLGNLGFIVQKGIEPFSYSLTESGNESIEVIKKTLNEI